MTAVEMGKAVGSIKFLPTTLRTCHYMSVRHLFLLSNCSFNNVWCHKMRKVLSFVFALVWLVQFGIGSRMPSILAIESKPYFNAPSNYDKTLLILSTLDLMLKQAPKSWYARKMIGFLSRLYILLEIATTLWRVNGRKKNVEYVMSSVQFTVWRWVWITSFSRT